MTHRRRRPVPFLPALPALALLALLLASSPPFSPPIARASMLPRGAHSARDAAELNFRRKVGNALDSVSRVLDAARSPRLFHEVDHAYEDKYSLAEFVVNSAVAALTNALDRMGLDASKLSRLIGASRDDGRTVTLRFVANETCEFVEERTAEEESPHEYETYETTAEGDVKREKRTRSRVVKKVREYHWSFGLKYSVLAFAGSDPDSDEDSVTLRSGERTTRLVVIGDRSSPRPDVYAPPAADLDLTWFLRQLDVDLGAGDSGSVCRFDIDRDADGCRTPRRNDDVDGAVGFFGSCGTWSARLGDYFTRDLRSRIVRYGPLHPQSEARKSLNRLVSMNDEIFVPVLPLFEGTGDGTADGERESAGPMLSFGDLGLFLDEQCRSIDGKIEGIAGMFPNDTDADLVSSDEASLALLAMHIGSISESLSGGVDFIEQQMRAQLAKAVGKDLRPSDFDDFLRFYYRKMFKDPYVPEPYVYAIRRPRHYPDGVLSIESRPGGGDDSSEPIVTTTRRVKDDGPMFLPISAATTVEFTGDRFLHAWVRHDFSGGGGGGSYVDLIARARQFSSFMLIIGTMSGPDSFGPKSAIILQNKDEVVLPLLLEPLPTPKEFRDAIESLSPEQRRFAEAFRGMQLETSVFGVLVVQLKPQLEAVLSLPRDSLTKEIGLTQDLLSLFIDHQIPSDLLTYDGDESAPVEDKVAKVKGHVASLKEMISDAKKRELEEAQRETDMRAEMKMHRKFEDNEYGDDEIDDEKDEGATRVAGGSARRLMRHMPRMMMAQSADMMAETWMESASFEAVEADAVPLMANNAFGEASHLRAHKAKEQAAAQPPPTSTSEPTKATVSGSAIDFTQIPKQLDRNFEELDDAAALRPTKIKIGEIWTKKFQKSLLTSLQTKSLGSDEQKAEKNKAFDLLDALSKSGALPIAHTELHVMVAATHGFDKSLVDTVIQDNINPIEKMERSLLIVSSTIHGLPVAELVSDDRAAEVASHSPALLESREDAAVLEDALKGSSNAAET